jgi:hypothetical protein
MESMKSLGLLVATLIVLGVACGGGTTSTDGGAGKDGSSGNAGTTGAAGHAGAGGAAGAGGKAGTTGTAGAGGKAGATGTAGAGGHAGASAGNTGSAGAAGAGGKAGAGGAGGAAGAGGATGSGACFDFVCNGTCKGTTCGAPWTCDESAAICTADIAEYCGCDGRTFTASSSCPNLAFSHRGPCNPTVSCDPRAILCKRLAPTCPTGQVPSIDDTGICYGECVPIEMCECTSAAACPDSKQYTCHMSAGHCGPYVN